MIYGLADSGLAGSEFGVMIEFFPSRERPKKRCGSCSPTTRT
jgi:hypothetical protein